MKITVIGYVCPFCGKYHKVGEPEFTAHYPNEREQKILVKAAAAQWAEKESK